MPKKDINVDNLIEKMKNCESEIDDLGQSINDKDILIVEKDDEIKKLKGDIESLSEKIKNLETEKKGTDNSHKIEKCKMENTIAKMRREINDNETNFSMLLKLHEELAKKSEKIDQDLYAHITELFSRIFRKTKTKHDTTSCCWPNISG